MKMCQRLKLMSEDNKWRIPMVSGLFAFTLGLSCFGVAFKLSEYEESLSLPPMLAGVPILIAGISGMVGGRMRKNCMISLHLVFCLIAGVLGLHLTFIFLGREAKSREIYKVKCQSQFKGAHYCHRYAATVGMTVLAMLPFALTPLGILSYAVTRRLTSRYNVNEEEEGEDTSTLDQHGDQESTMSKMEGRLSSPTIDSEATTESKNKGKLLIKQYNNNNNCNNSSSPSSYRESSRLVLDNQSHGENGQWPSCQVSDNAIPGNHGLQKQLSNGEAKFRKQGSCSQPPSSQVASRDHLVGRDCLQGYEPQRNQSSNEEAQINQLPRNQRRTNQERGKHKPSNHLVEKQVSRYKPRTNQELCNNTANNQTFINQESENYGSRNHGVSIQPSNVQMPNVLPTAVPISHLCSSQPSQNQNARKLLHPPTNHRRSKQIPNNLSTNYQVSSNEKRRSQAPHKQYPISNQSNQISRYYNPTTVDQQTKPLHLDGKQPLKDQQAFCKDMSRRQTPHYPYLPRNHPLRNQAPSHDQAPKSGE